MHLGSDTLVRTEEMDENGNFPSMTAGGRKKMPPSAMQAKMKTRNAMMPVFMCTACERTANDVSHALSRRHFAGDVWSSETRFAVWEDIRGLCVNPKLFPSEGSLYIDGCVKFLTDYSSKVCVWLELPFRQGAQVVVCPQENMGQWFWDHGCVWSSFFFSLGLIFFLIVIWFVWSSLIETIRI